MNVKQLPDNPHFIMTTITAMEPGTYQPEKYEGLQANTKGQLSIIKFTDDNGNKYEIVSDGEYLFLDGAEANRLLKQVYKIQLNAVGFNTEEG